MNSTPDKEILRKAYDYNYSQKEDCWSDIDLKNTYRIINRLTKYLKKKGFQVDHKMKSLDIGCAKGHHTEALRIAGFDSYGFDYSQIAIEIAKKEFPLCNFFVMDGFDPNINSNFDLIFMKGFSGTNTHDLDFVVNMCNKYVHLLNPKGWLIIAYSTNYSGSEISGETANWTKQEIKYVINNLSGVQFIDMKFFSFNKPRRLLRLFMNSIGIKRKNFFYLIYSAV
jgi:hypothetical protein